MEYMAQNPTWRRTVITDFLKALSTIPTATILTAPKVHLFNQQIQISPDTPLATFTAAECVWTGYAPVALVALQGPVNSIPNMQAMFVNTTFLAPNPLTQMGSAWGYWIDGLTPADWACAEQFPQSIPFALPGDFLDLDLLLGLPFMLQVS